MWKVFESDLSRQSRIPVHFIQNEAQGSSLAPLLLKGALFRSQMIQSGHDQVCLFCLKPTVAAQVQG